MYNIVAVVAFVVFGAFVVFVVFDTVVAWFDYSSVNAGNFLLDYLLRIVGFRE